MKNYCLVAIYALLLTSFPFSVSAQSGPGAMNAGGTGMMMDGGGMWVMMLFSMLVMVLLIVALILAILALLKYLKKG